jgi:hypothetical protein
MSNQELELRHFADQFPDVSVRVSANGQLVNFAATQRNCHG